MNLDLNDLPKEVTIELYLYLHNKWGWTHIFDDPDGLEDYTIISSPTQVTFNLINREEAVKSTIEQLRAEIQKIRAKAELECNALEEKIQSYLALPNLTSGDDE